MFCCRYKCHVDSVLPVSNVMDVTYSLLSVGTLSRIIYLTIPPSVETVVIAVVVVVETGADTVCFEI